VTSLVPIAAPLPDEKLGSWAQTFLQIASVSAELARTPFVPASLRVMERGRYDEGATAANVAAAILTGQELGMEPMSALRSINVINATPALSALALRALLQRQGHQIWLVEATNTRAVVSGLRAGEPESHTQTVTWTMDDAKSRNLAGKENWRKQPRNMLVARATADVARLVASDAILGVPYTIEELQDGDELVSGEEAPETAPPKRTARRKTAAVATKTSAQIGPGAAENGAVAPPPEDEPPFDAVGPHVDEPAGGHMVGYLDEPPLEDEPGTTATGRGTPITDAPTKALQASFRDLGIERAERLGIVTGIVARPVKSAKELTSAEASKVLDQLALSKARESASDVATFDAAVAEEGTNIPLEDEIPADAPATGEDFVRVRQAFDAAQFAGGREGQETRVRYASNLLGRQLSDPRDLTHGEAIEVVAALGILGEDMPPVDDGEAGV
jgi:hypothetical protein